MQASPQATRTQARSPERGTPQRIQTQKVAYRYLGVDSKSSLLQPPFPKCGIRPARHLLISQLAERRLDHDRRLSDGSDAADAATAACPPGHNLIGSSLSLKLAFAGYFELAISTSSGVAC